MKSIQLAFFWLISFGFLAVALVLFLKKIDDIKTTSTAEIQKNEELKKIRLAQYKVSRGVRDLRTYQTDYSGR